MYGSYINGPFMMPNMGYSPMMTMAPNMMRSSLGGGIGGGLRSLLGLTPRMGSAIGTAGRGINWASLLNNTSKTIGVVKEAIPIVKEVGPMMNNMRSMFKIASVFKDETDTSSGIKNTSESSTSNNVSLDKTTTESSQNYRANTPNFFL